MRISSCCLLVGGILFVTTACQEDPVFIEPDIVEERAFADVPEELWIYFEQFEAEALQRGVEIDLNSQSISAEINPIAEDGVAGTCSYGSHTPGHIVIDEEFWNVASSRFREMIVFHELGHCSLFIGHREGSHPDGTCLSIMRSGLDGCSDNYNALTREDYLDELFFTP